MEIGTQIATTREQSKRLLTIGIKPETADMVHHYTNSKVERLKWELQPHPPTLRGEYWTPQRISKLASPWHKNPDGTLMTGEQVFDQLWGKDIPAWSLDRLRTLLPYEIDTDGVRKACIQTLFHLDFGTIVRYHIEGEFEYFHQEVNINSFEAYISMIEWLINNKHLPTEKTIFNFMYNEKQPKHEK